jgi:hypothetical protein
VIDARLCRPAIAALAAGVLFAAIDLGSSAAQAQPLRPCSAFNPFPRPHCLPISVLTCTRNVRCTAAGTTKRLCLSWRCVQQVPIPHGHP